jgi:hypothetical protein
MKYARIINSTAVDVATDPATQFHPSLAAEFVEVPDEVERGWTVNESGVWSAPAPAPEPEPQPERPSVSPIEFRLLFTSPERVMLKQLRATDLILDDFLSIAEDLRLTHVNLALKSTQDGVAYAIGQLVAAGTIAEADAADRIEQILSGQPQ